MAAGGGVRRPRRKAIPVTLTPEQRRRLENLWFIYGNYGPKTTRGNHSFIQGLLERGEDERPLRIKGYTPTPECERAVDEILRRQNGGAGSSAVSGAPERAQERADTRGHLRLIDSEPEKKRHLFIDPEMKEIIEGMKRRQKESERFSSDEPDAA